MPSSFPTKPSFSPRVALIETSSMSQCNTFEIFVRIEIMCGAILGLSAKIVASILPI